MKSILDFFHNAPGPRSCFIIFVALLILTGCAHKQVSSAKPELMGPPLPSEGMSQGTSTTVGPMPSPDFIPPKGGYVLVLGPGLARSLAYLGVLREMEEEHLSIRAILGVEMGAIIGGIWASSNLNNLEWEMHKFKRKTLLDLPFFQIQSSAAEGKNLDHFLEFALKTEQLEKMKVPLLVASITNNEQSQEVLIEANGPAKEIIRGAMSIPGILQPKVLKNQERMTAAMEAPFPITQAKAVFPQIMSLGTIVCIDVMNGGFTSPQGRLEQQISALMKATATLAKQEFKDCDTVVHIPTLGIGYLNFDAKADLIYQGKLAIQNWQSKK